MRRCLQTNWLINNKDWIDKIKAMLILTNETLFVVVLIVNNNNNNNKKTRMRGRNAWRTPKNVCVGG